MWSNQSTLYSESFFDTPLISLVFLITWNLQRAVAVVSFHFPQPHLPQPGSCLVSDLLFAVSIGQVYQAPMRTGLPSARTPQPQAALRLTEGETTLTSNLFQEWKKITHTHTDKQWESCANKHPILVHLWVHGVESEQDERWGRNVYGLLNARLTTGGSSSVDPFKTQQVSVQPLFYRLYI